jgi:diguanylate cyclase (GGDEF)-like protein
MMKRLTNTSLKVAVVIALSCLAAVYARPSNPAPDPALNLNPDEIVWLSEHPKIRLGIDRAFAPFGSIDSNGEYIGFTADVMEIVSKKLGIDFEINKEIPWSETIELAKQGKIDIIAGLVITPARKNYLHFTSSYIKSPSIIVNNQDKDGYIGNLKNLYGKSVAIEKGSFSSDVLVRDHPEIKRIQVRNTELALGLVSSGQADAYVGNAVSASYLIRRLGFNNLSFSGNTEYYNNHSVGVVKPNEILASIMEKTISSIDLQTREEIANKWFGIRVRPHITHVTAIAFGALAVLLLTVAAVWIYTLTNTKKALRISEQKIRQQSNYDSLTGLLNRRHFNKVLAEEMDKTEDNSFALLFLDISQFKEVNDTLGHSIGDILLKRVSRRLKNSVRTSDVVARLGGDEFIIILKRVDNPETIKRVVQTVRSSLKSEFMIEGHSLHISSSIGVTQFPKDARTPDDILVNVDQAMNASKQLGPDSFSFFDESMRDALHLKNATLKDLKCARQKDQFELFYQPIINLKTGRITKAEALIRWQHPERGMIGPADFITLAEESGLILEMGEWIFETATKQVAQWRQQFSPCLQVSINTSPLQYRENGIDVKDWQLQLEALNLSGEALVLEITESLLMDTSYSVKGKLKQLANSGLEVAIDDFGTGYSSLSYMKKFDIDYLKIDQSFVKNLTADSEDMALCEAIIVMAHKLGCKVVAEGIETERQCRLLKKAGCDFGQGYLFSRPVNAAGFEALLAKGQPTLDPTASSQISLRL